jgi:hypothetical protein
MKTGSDDLSATVREHLRHGMPPAAIIDDLIKRGLSQATASRIVGRALAEADAIPEDEDEQPHGWTFPSWKVLLIAGIPALALIGYGGWVANEKLRTIREAKSKAAAEIAVAEESRAAENIREAKARREAEAAAREERMKVRIEKALTRLHSKNWEWQCDAALELGRLNARDHVWELTNLLWDEHASTNRACAADALIRLGEKKTVLDAYVQWADGTDSDLRRVAISGFGEIGPEAAEVAMPFLNAAMKSPDIGTRMSASLAISKVRPTPQTEPK